MLSSNDEIFEKNLRYSGLDMLKTQDYKPKLVKNCLR